MPKQIDLISFEIPKKDIKIDEPIPEQTRVMNLLLRLKEMNSEDRDILVSNIGQKKDINPTDNRYSLLTNKRRSIYRKKLRQLHFKEDMIKNKQRLEILRNQIDKHNDKIV